jgi:hypothetical protein
MGLLHSLRIVADMARLTAPSLVEAAWGRLSATPSTNGPAGSRSALFTLSR